MVVASPSSRCLSYPQSPYTFEARLHIMLTLRREVLMANSPRESKQKVHRRNFLKSAAGGTALLATNVGPAAAQEPQPVRAAAAVTPKETDPSSTVEVLTADRPG